MPGVVDHLAELTALRDRDLLDTTLAGALRELLRPRLVAIHRCVGEDGQRRWLTRARLAEHDVAATADSLWAELDSLPAFDAFPTRLEAIERQAPVGSAGAPGLTVFPLVTERSVVGVVEIDCPAPLSAEQIDLVSSILRIYRNFQSLLDHSEHDSLTGLLNRKTFDEAFYKLAGDSTLRGAAVPCDPRRAPMPPLAHHYVGMLDIDHFKTVNDNFGHQIGDEVLLLMARLMRSSLRFHDRLFRFGGEEFVVLMRCGSDADAGHAFERVRANVAAYAFPQVGRITVSIGYSEVRSTDSASAAVERADRAVYWAKSHGRDQVCSHDELVARGELVEATKVGDVELF